VILDCHVFKMVGVLFYVSAGFDLNETPAAVPPALQDVHPHQHAAVLKCGFKDCWNLWVGD